MEGWNPVGWLLLIGGFAIAYHFGAQIGDRAWFVSYAMNLAGLTILMTNLCRDLLRFFRRRIAIRARLRA